MERKNQSLENLRLAILRCQQSDIPIWELVVKIVDFMQEWATTEKFDVKITLVRK